MDDSFLNENFLNENRKDRLENDRIFRKSLLNGQTAKIARDNIKLRQNLKNLAKDFLRYKGNHDQKSSG